MGRYGVYLMVPFSLPDYRVLPLFYCYAKFNDFPSLQTTPNPVKQTFLLATTRAANTLFMKILKPSHAASLA